ncbi:flagellar biosynthesis protein FliQ [Candidatus Formimonas warabiya]|uniref:Flagellar biosynthetic protein FliQ n=1 Tax=Formimonas warabiya TaxID=1761012 RepID=A0A3G1KTD2_FORW1|nr:flagellar biosynthesis protein FliQ [Candidatus Formimonas warabiya]ATW25654.1 flagellar biosynthetic protein FliQ [Candidatus Formimonas warabiya]
MEQLMILKIAREALLLILLLSAPALLVGLLVGVAISVVQAATQIQEQTLTFVPKIVAIIITLLITASWMMDMLVSFTGNIFSQLANYVW